MEDVYLNLQPSPRLCHVSNQAARIAAGMKINKYIDLQTSLRLCHERNNASIFKPINSVHYQEKWDKVYKDICKATHIFVILHIYNKQK